MAALLSCADMVPVKIDITDSPINIQTRAKILPKFVTAFMKYKGVSTHAQLREAQGCCTYLDIYPRNQPW